MSILDRNKRGKKFRQSDTRTHDSNAPIDTASYIASVVDRLKDGKQLRASNKYDVTYKNDRATLKVKDVDAKDDGQYKCEASNVIGSVNTTASLTVQSEYEFMVRDDANVPKA